MARLLSPRDLIHLAQAIPGIEHQYNPRHWLGIRDQEGDTIFHRAAAEGLNDMIVSLLSKDFDTSVQNTQGLTALHRAAQSGHLGTVMLLLSAGLDPNMRAVGGVTALNHAVKNGDLVMIQQLISSGADVSVLTKGDYNILNWAVQYDSPGALKTLLDHGANPTTKDAFGRSPLHHAAYQCNVEMMELILSVESDYCCADHDGNSPADIVTRWKILQLVNLLGKPNCRLFLFRSIWTWSYERWTVSSR
ncbi:hypothetical protein AbraIFM66951_005162 [Aspergillus brasiliensis]|nr:hypothetical protein AbraIFM66951_005162 [Aspergillus brasiliensis]